MDSGWATLETIGGKTVLRFERRLAHPPEKVFRAVSDPAELEHWFPAAMETELRPGAAIRFTFEEHDGDAPGGEVLEVDPPKLLVYTWGDDVLRWEIVPEGDGCRLFFSQTLGGDASSAPRNAAGWDVCLASLTARIDGVPPAPTEWFPLFAAYVERYGLDEGTEDGGVLRFERDVVQTPAQVWAFLTDGEQPAVGAPAPRRFSHAPASLVTAVEPERELAFGTVRWTLEPRLPGALIVVEETLPADAAAWREHLTRLVSALYFSAAGQAMR